MYYSDSEGKVFDRSHHFNIHPKVVLEFIMNYEFLVLAQITSLTDNEFCGRYSQVLWRNDGGWFCSVVDSYWGGVS